MNLKQAFKTKLQKIHKSLRRVKDNQLLIWIMISIRKSIIANKDYWYHMRESRECKRFIYSNRQTAFQLKCWQDSQHSKECYRPMHSNLQWEYAKRELTLLEKLLLQQKMPALLLIQDISAVWPVVKAASDITQAVREFVSSHQPLSSIIIFFVVVRGFLFSCNHLIHRFLTTLQFRGGLSSTPDFCTLLHWVPQTGKTLTPLPQWVKVFACLDWEHKWHPLEALLCLLAIAAVITRITLFSALEQMKKLPCEHLRQCPAGTPGHIPAFVIPVKAACGSLSHASSTDCSTPTISGFF